MSRAKERSIARVPPPAVPAPAAERLFVRIIAAWDRYWFGEIAAIRPYLLVRVVLCMVAFDVWMVRVPVGGRYGTAGFDVAHFRWLDALQPLPSPDLYVGLMLTVGLLALVCVFIDADRWIRALVALLYTYGWAMSLHDAFQHHYLLSLVLTTFVFFPRVRAGDSYPARAGSSAKTHRRAASVDRHELTVSSWAYALLGANVGIVYAYTAVTKWDMEWRVGGAMGRLGGQPLATIDARLVELGLPPGFFGVMQGLAGFAVECLLAVAYVLAVRLDRSRSRWLRTVTWLAFLAAVGFHVGVETALRLRIGWFSYYMIAFACVYFLPSSLLSTLGALVYRPAARLSAVGRVVVGRTGMLRVALTTLAVVGAAVLVVSAGRALDLPGARMVGFLVAATLLAASLVALGRRRPQDALRIALATGLAGACMWLTVEQSTTRLVYHLYVGTDLRMRGNLVGAVAAFERAKRYVPSDRRLDDHIGRLRRQLERPDG